MSDAISIHLPYPVIFVSDETMPGPPEVRDHRISSNGDALTIPCPGDPDAPTRIALVPSAGSAAGTIPQFDGFIATPRKCVVVSTAVRSVVLRLPVNSTRTRLQVFLNDLRFPDDILIVAD